VHAGQVVGQCGYNGNSSYPHLHINMQSSPDPLNFFGAIGLPMVFVDAKVFNPAIGQCVPFNTNTIPKGAALC
jgi:hypothetical protein